MRNRLHRISILLVPAMLAPALSHAAHPGIELRTFSVAEEPGAPLRGQLDTDVALSANGSADKLVAGPPMSPRQSCDGCHDYDAITAAYHFQLGADERVDLDGDGFADELGQALVEDGGPFETLPTLYNVNSPGQFGAW
jgi:hypothetical protein